MDCPAITNAATCFVEVPARPATIEPTNKAAERALRPAVIARKISHWSKNEKGAESNSAFKSVIRTLKNGSDNLLEKLTRLIDRSPTETAASAIA